MSAFTSVYHFWFYRGERMWLDGGEENIRDILSAECSVTPALPPVTSLIIENHFVVYNGKWEHKFFGHCVYVN